MDNDKTTPDTFIDCQDKCEAKCCECGSLEHCCHDCPVFGGPEDTSEE